MYHIFMAILLLGACATALPIDEWYIDGYNALVQLPDVEEIQYEDNEYQSRINNLVHPDGSLQSRYIDSNNAVVQTSDVREMPYEGNEYQSIYNLVKPDGSLQPRILPLIVAAIGAALSGASAVEAFKDM